MRIRKDHRATLNIDTKPEKNILKSILSWIFGILVVLLFAFVIVNFFAQERTNVGESMDVTLSNGDKVLINTLAYRLTVPKRNDIIVFKPDGNQSSYSYIKRVIGLPGETIQIKDGIIYINDKVYLEDIDVPVMSTAGLAAEPIEIAGGEVFVLGDNRNNSDDSRFVDVGNVQIEDIEGKVWYIISPNEKRGLIK